MLHDPPRAFSAHVRMYRTHGHTVVELNGEIDLAVVEEIGVRLQVAEALPGDSLVIDLSPTTFFGSSGLRLLCGTRDRVQARGGCLRVVCPHALTLRVLRFAGPFRVLRTLDEALGRTPV
ncbi:STAS domain-containing protein [Streptomyces sp. CWNU-52B]|uniref:STAS domain-containing protein n=1 Tax=unclassified Streptomyces TaxID=2593676 RepID=UPI0039BF350C